MDGSSARNRLQWRLLPAVGAHLKKKVVQGPLFTLRLLPLPLACTRPDRRPRQL